MNEETSREVLARKILDAVADAVVTGAPLVARETAPFVALAVGGIRAIISLAIQLGHGDAIVTALDAELALARKATDEALDAKHGRA